MGARVNEVEKIGNNRKVDRRKIHHLLKKSDCTEVGSRESGNSPQRVGSIDRGGQMNGKCALASESMYSKATGVGTRTFWRKRNDDGDSEFLTLEEEMEPGWEEAEDEPAPKVLLRNWLGGFSGMQEFTLVVLLRRDWMVVPRRCRWGIKGVSRAQPKQIGQLMDVIRRTGTDAVRKCGLTREPDLIRNGQGTCNPSILPVRASRKPPRTAQRAAPLRDSFHLARESPFLDNARGSSVLGRGLATK